MTKDREASLSWFGHVQRWNRGNTGCRMLKEDTQKVGVAQEDARERAG